METKPHVVAKTYFVDTPKFARENIRHGRKHKITQKTTTSQDFEHVPKLKHIPYGYKNARRAEEYYFCTKVGQTTINPDFGASALWKQNRMSLRKPTLLHLNAQEPNYSKSLMTFARRNCANSFGETSSRKPTLSYENAH